MISYVLILAGFWFIIALMAVGNGAMRDLLYAPRWGETAAHAVSSIILAALIVGVSALMLVVTPYPRETNALWIAGGCWLGATLVFESVFFHYVMKTPWHTIRAEYNIFCGRLWLVVLAATLTGPRLAGYLIGGSS
jgi:hypothetical protein